ncbi:hypothetical protein FNF29_01491 [Cafeteria roenbergensis]|uniref:EF-hand domain-containing protein n=1 Tax=Cafeteria roenbergensis TaxID=33653 RepID=A0A5A8C8Y4_CAFRO|nr:hypothetical protein FNF31_07185 [Cafeteria roenbergensis]KAA0155574.1 hypothetical protein FNF29_01491 [Cafeteria roenbergensis]KAA0161088.1 hypothetical protein FNF28_05190 [Cafeteria roenbergensis]|eukprot:KAA0155574.1 hypothetical protein FNF29_01491 [Cafeteria roenbergensis]
MDTSRTGGVSARTESTGAGGLTGRSSQLGTARTMGGLTSRTDGGETTAGLGGSAGREGGISALGGAGRGAGRVAGSRQGVVDMTGAMAQRFDVRIRQLPSALKNAFSPLDLVDLLDAFDAADDDNSGGLSLSEVVSIVDEHEDHEAALDDVAALLEALDADGSGELEFPEFLSLVYMLRHGRHPVDDEGSLPGPGSTGRERPVCLTGS